MSDKKLAQLTQRVMVEIGHMHKNISLILQDQRRKSYEYAGDFLKKVSELIESLGIFPYHITWEYLDQSVPANPQAEEKYLLLEVTPPSFKNRDIPLKENVFPGFTQEEYLEVPLEKNKFRQKFLDYFKKFPLEHVFEIPLKSGFFYLNLPVFSEQHRMPQWIFTLIYDRKDEDLFSDQEFIDILEHLSQQIGIAWDKSQEKITSLVLDKIDTRLGGEERTAGHSTLNQLKIIAEILAQEFQVEWGGFFLADDQKNILKLEAGNVDLELDVNYDLNETSQKMVDSFKKRHILRVMSRKNLEDIITGEELKLLEKGIRYSRKRSIYNAGKHYFTPYILFEHALFFPIAFGSKKLGITTLFRARRTKTPEPNDRYQYATHPFSPFETFLLGKVQRYIFNIFISHEAVKKRMQEVRRVISPISEVITSTEKVLTNSDFKGSFKDMLQDINTRARIASQYVMNFETLLDIDSRGIEIKRQLIPDLRKYLIGFAKLYTPLIRPKCIHINVTRETPDNLAIEVDRELFDLVISNIVDNAVKYSFDPEERLGLGLQAKPGFTEDKENILITAHEDDYKVNITFSSCGPELFKEEREHIFSREFRGIHGFDRAEGSGEGLFLAKEIVEHHGGTIEVVPDSHKCNTTFKISLPKKGVGPLSKPSVMRRNPI